MRYNPNNIKILFILRQRSSYGISYGLKNSCFFVCQSLERFGYDCKIVEVIDTTFIDREVHKFRPDFVVLEALWAEAARLPQIFKLHPKVKKWTARIHSKSSFLAHEGQAIQMIKDYDNLSEEFPNFTVSGNNIEFIKEIGYSTNIKLDYLPNIYLLNDSSDIPKDKHPNRIDIGCFGSLRPMKAQLIQAMAAMRFSDNLDKVLHFHINGDRKEQRGENVHKNLVALFENTNHKLVCHDWQNHSEFLKLVARMDLGMQVSMNESFNIVAADFIRQNIPIVVSDEIKLVLPIYRADVNSIDDMISKLEFAYYTKPIKLHLLNRLVLNYSNSKAEKNWLEFLNN